MDKTDQMRNTAHRITGLRVKSARVAKGWTQERLASGMGLNDRQTVSDIEKGKRALKTQELAMLPSLLGRDTDFFLDPFSVAGEAQYSWRAAPDLPESVLHEFEIRAGQWIGLLRWMQGQQGHRRSAIKRCLHLSHQSSFEDAQDCAESLVSELGFGTIPADCLRSKIEQELDIPVLFFDAADIADGQSISGAACHLEEMSVILINRNEHVTRQTFNLAHELFHAMTWDAMKPEHRMPNSRENRRKGKRIEQMADNFAAALAMPRASLDTLIPREKLADIPHLCLVAKVLLVPPAALGWRLFNLRLIDEESRRSLSQRRAPRQDPGAAVGASLFSNSYVRMLHDALENGWISRRKAGDVTGLGFDGLTRLLAHYGYISPYQP